MSKSPEQTTLELFMDSTEMREIVDQHYTELLVFGHTIIDGVAYEMHADGLKEVPCDFCEEACKTDWCPTKDK